MYNSLTTWNDKGKFSFFFFLLHFPDSHQRPKRHWFHWDPEEGQSYPLPWHGQAVARQLHKFGHQKPRKTGRAGQQLQASTGAKCPTGRDTTPSLLPHPSPQKQVGKLRPATVVGPFIFGFVCGPHRLTCRQSPILHFCTNTLLLPAHRILRHRGILLCVALVPEANLADFVVIKAIGSGSLCIELWLVFIRS